MNWRENTIARLFVKRKRNRNNIELFSCVSFSIFHVTTWLSPFATIAWLSNMRIFMTQNSSEWIIKEPMSYLMQRDFGWKGLVNFQDQASKSPVSICNMKRNSSEKGQTKKENKHKYEKIESPVNNLTTPKFDHKLKCYLKLSVALESVWVFPIATVIWPYTRLHIPSIKIFTLTIKNLYFHKLLCFTNATAHSNVIENHYQMASGS